MNDFLKCSEKLGTIFRNYSTHFVQLVCKFPFSLHFTIQNYGVLYTQANMVITKLSVNA
jgi:hypothetical protein